MRIAASTAAVLEVQNVSKRFGGVQALEAVDLTLPRGGRVAVVGENGAGKSTLMRVIAGLARPDAGTVRIDGKEVDFSATAARRAGVALVHQELSLVPSLSVAENISLGHPPTYAGVVTRRPLRRQAIEALDRLGIALDVDELVERLPLARRQYVEIARAVRQEPKILVLDEPTATLTPPETAELLATLERLASEGMAVLFVSHRLPEIFTLCTRATVLRDGRVVADVDLAESSPDVIVENMVGRELAAEERRPERAPGPVVLRATGLGARGVTDVDLELHRGEILGLGGLVGAGRSELARALVGLNPVTAGTVELKLGDSGWAVRTYAQAIRHGLAFVPEERRAEGVALGLSVADNLALPSARELSAAAGWLPRGRIGSWAAPLFKRFGIRTSSPSALVASLSGGNQQKVALGRWLQRKPEVLVLDEPTRGVDVGAKAEVHRLIRAAAGDGCALLVVSSDLPELLTISDRIAVMRDGRITGELPASDATEDSVMRLATGRVAV